MTPKLYLFAISHYCEKARWALDYLQIDYEIVYAAPGLHLALAKKLGLSATTLPFLDNGSDIIQGSAAIIDWAESATNSSRSLTPVTDAESCRAIEKRLDDITGVHTRRLFYSEALIEHAATVKPVFTRDLSTAQRVIITFMWPSIRRKMITGMDLGRRQGVESKAILEDELSWLDGLLAPGKTFLTGDTLTRADIAAASFFAPVAGVKEHPSQAFITLPPRTTLIAQRWHERPAMVWIREIYRQYRN